MSFEPDPKARASHKPGTVYAICGLNGWFYWAQIKSELETGFFSHRSKEQNDVEAALASPVLIELTIGRYSLGRALRAGIWKKVGVYPIGSSLSIDRPKVHWPVGTNIVSVVSFSNNSSYKTTVDNPDIQDFEISAAWDCEYHVPMRLAVEFGDIASNPALPSRIRDRRKQKNLGDR